MAIKSIRWGNPNISDYDLILDHYSETKINSIKTSSVPLAQYWKETEKRISQLSKLINENLDDAEIYFEYPTKSLHRAKSSMSDVMIIANSLKIAIEGKYTEYQKTGYQLIDDWLNENNYDHRTSVLNHWKNMIIPFVESPLDNIDHIPYQFFHRTASACFENDGKAYVLYQLFFDDEIKSDLEKFIALINTSIEKLHPNENLKILIQKIKIKKINEVDKKHVFQKMKSTVVYEFED